MVQSLKAKMEKIVNRFSQVNLKQFKAHDAELLHADINFELDDPDRLENAVLVHMKATHGSSFSQIIAMTMLAEGSLDPTAEHYSDIAAMLGSCKDVESAEVPDRLEKICNAIYLSGLSADFIAVAPAEGEQWLNKNCPKAANLLNNFLTRHAHRAIKEFDLKSITWGMNPSAVIAMLQPMCRHLNDVLTARPMKTELSTAQIIKQLKSPKKSSTRKVLGYVLPICQRLVQRRETTKSYLIAYIHELRKAYNHLAGLLVQQGLLPDRQLIFYLDRDELSGLIDKSVVGKPPVNKAALVAKAQRRMRMFAQWNGLVFEEFNEGLVKPISAQKDCNAGGDGVESVRGASVSEGLVTGRACVITRFSEVNQIRAGDILVTLATDIGWSTYFPILGGVVTELGGLISHG